MAILEDILHQMTRIANALEASAMQSGTVQHASNTAPPMSSGQLTNGALQGGVQAQLPLTTHVQQAINNPPPATNITAEAITALIQPHVANPAIKEALGVTMRSMGINALPDTQPHQFAELYARFQAVINNTGMAQAHQQPSSASII